MVSMIVKYDMVLFFFSFCGPVSSGDARDHYVKVQVGVAFIVLADAGAELPGNEDLVSFFH